MVNGDAFEIEAGSGQGTLGDTIINNIRFLGPTDGTGGDTIALNAYAAGSKGITRVVIDNCTMGYGGDSCCDIVGDVNEVTISWNFFYRSNRPMLLNQGANGNEVRENISIHHNVYGFCDERQPQIQYTNTTIDFVNNVVYGWGWERGVVGALKFSIGGSASNPSMNVTNNYYKYVANVFNPDEDEAIWWSGGTPFGDVYFSGNTFPAGENDETSTTGSAISISQSVTTYAASTLGDNVVPTVGTQYPTQFEKNMLDTIATDIGGNPDTIVPGEAAL
jgi:pectate lyase